MSAIPFNTSDLSIGEQQRLDEIRLKKQRLLDEIQVLYLTFVILIENKHV